MKQDIELNDTQVRGINRILQKVKKRRKETKKKDSFYDEADVKNNDQIEFYETSDDDIAISDENPAEEIFKKEDIVMDEITKDNDILPVEQVMLKEDDMSIKKQDTTKDIQSEKETEENPQNIASVSEEIADRKEETKTEEKTEKEAETEKQKEKKKIDVASLVLPVKQKFEELKNKLKERKEKTPKEKPVKQPKEKKEKKKKDNDRPKGKKITFALAILVCIILFIGIIGVIGAGVFAYKLCEDKPELNVADLRSPDSSMIYDSDGNKIMEIGLYLRENIPYEQMPNCLIDAFLAIEDSRFFEHIGFDIPRFTKAVIENVKTRDFSQGGSTVTMQLIKNSYFSIDAGEDSTIASRTGMSGIKRKMQEIVLALELENLTDTTKQEILALYINKVNYGNNIRGVQKAAEYYFGKDAKELNLSESAFLAGLINSPNTYNPYNDLIKEDNYYLDPDSNYLQNAYERRAEVLDLMVMHGYISQKEADLANSVRMEDLLIGEVASFSEVNEKYQSYIDAVIDEVIDTTGESPYEVGMNIYTNMNAYMQEYVYDMQNEEEYTGIEFPNELCQSAIVVMDNQNGAIEALGGGRGETDSARQFNRATSAYLNPGSSIKPVVDYALAIEALGYATSHTFTDMPYYLYGGNVLISNYDRKYIGDMLMTEALGRSQNTPAVQALAAVVEEKGDQYVVDYLNSIGFNFDYADFDLQFAIGGNRCLVTPLQLAGAHAMFINGGRYIKPHAVNYIEYTDGRDNFIADTKGTQAISDATAWMVAYLEEYNMTGGFSSLMWYCKRGRDYPLYGKTGTTDWGNSGTDFGIPVGATKDSWLVMQTNKYTISCWTGYDKLERGAYFTSAEYQANTKSQIVSAILDQLEEHHLGEYDPYTPLQMPDSVTEFTHVRGAYPYATGGGYGNVTGYIAKKALEEHPLISASEAYSIALENVKRINGGIGNITGSFDGTTVVASFGAASSSGGVCVGDGCDLSTTNIYGETTYANGRIWFPHWSAVYSGGANPPYIYTITLDTGEVVSGSTDGLSFSQSTGGGSQAQVCISSSTSSQQACVTLRAG